MDDAIRINDLVIAPEVIETLIALSVEKVPGVAAVGAGADIGDVFSLFSSKKPEAAPPDISLNVEDNKLSVVVHLSILFGYPFVTLADEVREAIRFAVASQVGIEVSKVDVFIDTLLFPKE